MLVHSDGAPACQARSVACPPAAFSHCRLMPLAAAVALCFAGSASSATITVDSSSGASEAGHCSLIDAVISVNAAASANGSSCAAGDGNNDTINLSFNTPTSITFNVAMDPSDSALALTVPATISGSLDAAGKPFVTITRSAVSGTPSFRLIQTNSSLALIGVTLSNGFANLGGGIDASEGAAVVLTSSVISGNTATGKSMRVPVVAA
jgi:hypothetical protein